MKLKGKLVYKGGPGSGHHGHAGRPGKRGGSSSGGSGSGGGSTARVEGHVVQEGGNKYMMYGDSKRTAWRALPGDPYQKGATIVVHRKGIDIPAKATGWVELGKFEFEAEGGKRRLYIDADTNKVHEGLIMGFSAQPDNDMVIK